VGSPTRARAAFGAAYDYLANRFGGLVGVRESVTTVGVAVVALVGNNPERVSLTIVNLGATEVFIATSESVSTSRGIRLTANGGGITLSVDTDGPLSALPWFAISSVAGNPVFAMEVVRESTYT
jgi:hypothetical protein